MIQGFCAIIKSVSTAFSYTDIHPELAARKSTPTPSPPISLPFFPCGIKQWLSLQQHALWENVRSLAENKDSRKRETNTGVWHKKIEKKLKERRSWKLGPARFRPAARCMVWLAKNDWPHCWDMPSRDTSIQLDVRDPKKYKAPKMPATSLEIITWKQVYSERD